MKCWKQVPMVGINTFFEIKAHPCLKEINVPWKSNQANFICQGKEKLYVYNPY